tara:strand:- start:6 stop:440 length:435 start_codon:yes stop_codon:yes gene_type:complete
MIAIPSKDIFIFEDKIRKMLDKSFEDVTNPKIYETEDWINRLKSGLVICFADRSIEFIIICSNANSTLYLNVIAGKNFSKHVDEAIEDITDFAKFAGCKTIQTTARFGAAKSLEKVGFQEVKYKKKHKTVVKVIGDSQTSSAGR